VNNSPLSRPDPFGFSYSKDLFGGLDGWWMQHVPGGVDLAQRGIQ
jgi:hypothetical protein